MARKPAELATNLRRHGKHMARIADWLDENGYRVVAATRTNHWKVTLEKDGVQRFVSMSSSPGSEHDAFQCIRQMIVRVFRDAERRRA